MKVLYTCDLHGRRHLYEETLRSAVRSEVDIVILGGDLLPTIIPNPLTLISGSADFQDDLRAQIDFVDTFLAPAIHSFLAENPMIGLAYIPGNHDWVVAMERLEQAAPDAVNIHLRPMDKDDISLFGYACVTDSTFWVKDYVRRDRIADTFVPSKFALLSDTDRLVNSSDGAYALSRPSIEEELAMTTIPDPDRTVAVFHCPPHATGIDTLHNSKPIGSRSVLSFLERTQPMMSLHGHIHEAPYISGIFHTRVGRCLAVNPGQGITTLHALTFDASDPAGTLTHSVFGTGAPGGALLERMADNRMRKIKALFMDKVLKAK